MVVLNDIIDLDHIAALREKMLADLPAYLARKDAPFNFNTGNVQQEPPPFAPYLFQDILLNDIVIAVTHSLLGDGLHNGFYSGNTAIGGSAQRQPVHADTGQLWPNLTVAHPPYGLVVNVPVVDVTAANGSTEIWPGTHTDTTITVQAGDIKLPPAVVEARRAVRPPLQPSIRAGECRHPRHSDVARRDAEYDRSSPSDDRHDPLCQLVAVPAGAVSEERRGFLSAPDFADGRRVYRRPYRLYRPRRGL